MEDKEVWLILFHGFITGGGQTVPIDVAANGADIGLAEYKNRYDPDFCDPVDDDDI